jgi:hypothetical protein
MEKETILVSSGSDDVTSVTLEIIPDLGYVVAARDFVAGPNPDATGTIINSITLSDSESTGGPQNDGSYTANNKVIVTVDFVDSYAPTENITLDIDPSGRATAEHLVPVKLQGTFVVPGSPTKVTFTESNVEDFASSPSTTDFYLYDNPGDELNVMTMTIAATAGDFISEDPTIVIANPSDSTAEDDYIVTRVNTFDSSNRLTQAVYTIKALIPKVSRSGDVITFTAAGEDIPGLDSKIYAYRMNTGDAGTTAINRRLEIYGDENAQFRIKMERGTVSGSTFTIDPTDGIYVFDNSLETIAEAFDVSSSTVTYPSQIDSVNGTYSPAVDPYTIGSTGLFFRNIVIPEDVEDKVYRFTIIPETGTTVDPNAPGYLDVTPDPDVITFDITRRGYVFFTSDFDAPSRGGLTNTIEYYDYLFDSKGSVEPRGRKNFLPEATMDTYSYRIVITDDDEDFHLPNEENSYVLKEFNYTETLGEAEIIRPTITADVRASDDGFFAGEMSSVGHISHNNANNHEPDVDIVLTLAQREALTNKTGFNTESFSSAFSFTNTNYFFKIKFFTTDETPVYKSQTIEIESDLSVSSGDDAQQNTTIVSAPAINRRKLYISGDNLQVIQWGSSDATFTHNLDSFAFKTAQSSVTTLDLQLNMEHIVSEFINSVGRVATYSNQGYVDSILVSSDGGASYIKQNITTSTTHAKFTINNAILYAQDGLPVDFDVNDYELLFTIASGTSSELASVNLNIPSQPTVSLDSGSTFNRNLTVGSGNPPTFEVIVDFNNTLSSLTSSNTYVLNCKLNHRLSSSYQNIGDAEEYFGGISEGVVPSPF